MVPGLFDGFILKLSATGNFIWAKQIGGTAASTNNDCTVSIVIDTADNLYIGGTYGQNTDFDTGPGSLLSWPCGSASTFMIVASAPAKSLSL